MSALMGQVCKNYLFIYNSALNTTLNACLACHSDCMEDMCLELSFEDSNSDKCTNCSDSNKFLDGTLFTGGSCVNALDCPP